MSPEILRAIFLIFANYGFISQGASEKTCNVKIIPGITLPLVVVVTLSKLFMFSEF